MEKSNQKCNNKLLQIKTLTFLLDQILNHCFLLLFGMSIFWLSQYARTKEKKNFHWKLCAFNWISLLLFFYQYYLFYLTPVVLLKWKKKFRIAIYYTFHRYMFSTRNKKEVKKKDVTIVFAHVHSRFCDNDNI